MRLTAFVATLASVVYFLPRIATAELVRFEIAGTLTNVSGIEPVPANAPALGSPFIGSYIFDTDAVDTNASGAFGTYRTGLPPSSVSLKVGSWEWAGTNQSPTFIVVGNDLIGPNGTYDSYEVGHSRLDLLTPEEPNFNLSEYWLFQWRLDGPSTIFNSTDLPEQAFALNPWSTNRWSISQWGSPPAPLFELSGVVDSFTTTEKTWTIDADGIFSVGANWTGGIAPAGAGDIASFGNIITANRTVTVTDRVTVGTLKFNDNNNYTLAGGAGITLEVPGAGNAVITVLNTGGNGAHTINSPLIVADSLVITQDSTQPLTIGGGFNVSGQSVTKVGLGTVIVPRVRAASLSVNSGVVVVTPEGSSLGTSELNALSVGATAKLDLNNNDLVVHATAATKHGVHADIEADIVTAQNGVDANFVTKWDGPGITSSAARATNVAAGFDLTALGVIRNSDLDVTTGVPGSTYTSFSGRPVMPDDVLVKYTYTGDGNLDGAVTFDDYAAMDAAFFGLIPNLGWATGNINFDGVINFDDYSKVDQAFFFQGAPLRDGDVAAVPEAGTWVLGMLACLTVLTMQRSSRRHHDAT
jgi:hypothetical protein